MLREERLYILKYIVFILLPVVVSIRANLYLIGHENGVGYFDPEFCRARSIH